MSRPWIKGLLVCLVVSASALHYEHQQTEQMYDN